MNFCEPRSKEIFFFKFFTKSYPILENKGIAPFFMTLLFLLLYEI